MSRLFQVGKMSIVLLVIWYLVACSTRNIPDRPVVKFPESTPASSTTHPSQSSVFPDNFPPSPGEYVAFSLRIAQQKIGEVAEGRDYRVVSPEVYTLAGINQIHGLVYDRKAQDVILVGLYDPDLQPVTLDDFAVALRARFLHGTWPVVSIDPTKDSKQTGMQIVRFEGGIEETQFGADLLDADYRLKRISMGLLPSGVPGLRTPWDLSMDEAKKAPSGTHSIQARFWFSPVLPSVSVREDVVAIKGLTVGVFTEVLSAEINGRKIKNRTTYLDGFSKAVSEHFDRLSRMHPSFARVQSLDELVALTRALEMMDEKPTFHRI